MKNFWHHFRSYFGGKFGSNAIHSYINKEIVIQGDLKFQEGEGGIHIDGQVFGNIIDYSEKARVVVGKTGVVCGSITAGYLVLLGRVEGNVMCKHFEIFGDAIIEGDIQYQSFAMHSGRIAGRLLPYTDSDESPVLVPMSEDKAANKAKLKLKS